MASVTLSTAEKVTFTLSGVDQTGALGAAMQNAVAASSDPTVALVTLNADGVSGVVTPTGVPGQMSVVVTAQNADGKAITGQGDVTVTAVAPPLAVAVDVSFQAPTPK